MGHNEKIINLEFILPDIIHFFILPSELGNTCTVIMQENIKYKIIRRECF
jgi:hypothetical protein